MIGWNFPSNGGGAINGVADSGVEIFRGKEIPSLAREICQNSLDAARDENSAVIVDFYRHEISPKNIPDVDRLKNIFQACLTFWSRKSRKTEAFIKSANVKLKSSQVSVLRISDFNTTGLAEPFNPRAMQGWNTLTKINGGAIKPGTAAGNFGIGKNVPFANSFFRTIFYRTLNTTGERAAQAVAKLVSFDLDAENIAAGTGYFGETQGNMPVKKIPALDEIYRRTRRGTDVFVYGFNGGENWGSELVAAVIENFLVAIHRDKLRVTVQGQAINKNTLKKFVAEDAANYYKILTGDDAIKRFEKDFHGMGTLKLGVLLDPTTKLNRKVLIVRKSGMKLFELDRFARTLNFTAILELEGLKLNAFFREMETPDHTRWESSRHPTDPTLAKKYLAELKSWVRKQISELGAEIFSDETDVKGLSGLLNFDDGAVGGNKISSDDEKNSSTKNNGGDEKNSSGGEKISGTNKNSGGGTRQPPQPPKLPDGRIFCDKVRVIKLDEKTYRLILRVPRKISDGRIEISAVGESNLGEKISIARATSEDSNSQVFVFGDKIFFKNLRGKADAKIIFKPAENKNYALGVAVYED